MTTTAFLLKKWTRFLGLQDWKIVLRTNCDPSETENAVAETEWDEVHKCAVIKIISPEKYGKRIVPFCFEKTLIHELLHIKFAMFDGYTQFQDRYLHQIIEDFAKMLYKLNHS